MTDVVLNLNCSEHAIYSRILGGCVYIIKYGLNSPEIFLRRVQKRQAKRLRKKGVNINAKGFEYAVAENILYNLKVLPAPLIPATIYSKLRQLLDIYGKESRSKFITDAFKDTNPANMYVLQALLKTTNLLGTFEKAWKCPCGKELEGNGLSWTMVALPITSYIMREKCVSTGHWFVSWGQQASDVEVVKILIKHWQDIHNVSATNLPAMKPIYLSTVQTWYCYLTNGLHLGIEPKEIPILELENIITPVSFKQDKTPKGDFDISLYSISNYADIPDNYKTGDSNFNTITTLDSLDQLYMDNMENLQSLKDRLDSLSSTRSVTSSTKSGYSYTDNCDSETDQEQCDAIRLVKWMTDSRQLESIWSNCDKGDERYEEQMDTEDGDQIATLARNVVAGCGGGNYDLWGDYIPPPADTVVSTTHSKSYWSDYSEMTKREMLVSRLRQVIQRSLRKTKEKLQAEAKIEAARAESIIAADSPRLIAPPAKTSFSPSTSRILELLVKSNPITDISELEKLADKLSTTKSTQSNATCPSNPFKKPPHLIREFIPKKKVDDNADNAEYLAHSALQLDLKPIKLTVEPYRKPVISINLDGEHFFLDDLDLNIWSKNVSGYYQTDYPIYPSALAGSTHQYTVSPTGLTFLPSPVGAGSPIIPPIPKELESTTPPNLPTVIMLSQLFSTNGQ